VSNRRSPKIWAKSAALLEVTGQGSGVVSQ
jgi:hypothetical protein